MARRRTIVGIGEAVLAEQPDRDEPAGLAAAVSINAVMLGHAGIAISRVGQDQAGSTLVERLRALGVDTTHVQGDPDLATPRVRPGGGRSAEGQMAFDNLQWDFDLSDVAQQTDAVVFGALARRSGQTRSTIDRFLAECTSALKIFDLTGGHGLQRATALPALRSVDAAVADLRAVRALVPGAAEAEPRDAALQLVRSMGLSFLLLVGDGTPTVHTTEAAHEGRTALEPGRHEATVVAIAHGVLSGWGLHESLRLADQFARHRRDHPDEPAPTSMVVTTGG